MTVVEEAPSDVIQVANPSPVLLSGYILSRVQLFRPLASFPVTIFLIS